MRYLLGVDGGNTKTDYLLCTEDGEFVDVYRSGSCSHEHRGYGFDGMERVMREQLDLLFARNGITAGDIAAGGFGLAGADFAYQAEELTKRVRHIGFTRFAVANDGILGVKAATERGVGLCVVNGTGTVVLGIDSSGTIQQVSGVGEVSGDQAGGGHIVRQVMYHLYAHYYRCGPFSGMFEPLLALLKAGKADIPMLAGDLSAAHRNAVAIIQLADQEARNGDAVAKKIFDEMGVSMGQSAAGCVRLLHFDTPMGSHTHPIPMVLVGSIWHKTAYSGMRDAFVDTFTALTDKACVTLPLNAPPAVGGVLWAREIQTGEPAEAAYRDKVLAALPLSRYESLVYKK